MDTHNVPAEAPMMMMTMMMMKNYLRKLADVMQEEL
jgi:hypothetical protein